MKNIGLILTLFAIVSCKQNVGQNQDAEIWTSNEELKAIYEADQSDRQVSEIDWSIVSVRDKQRQERVYELLDSNLVRTSDDYANAAMVFQHGDDTIASGMAVKLMRKAIELDSTRSEWLLAAAIDRDLQRRGKPQIYGTQYWWTNDSNQWIRYELDSTIITDEQRKEYGVRTLAEQREQLRLMNKKRLSELFQAGTNIDEIIKLVQSSNLQNSEYNLSESGINSFGYELMGEGKDEEALKIFKLNTELYPEGYNTHDSYGECLLKMGRTEEAFAAYKKSLELNPNNDTAKKVLNNLPK